MNKPKFFIFGLLFLIFASSVFAQNEKDIQIEPSYEIVLQVVSATNNQTEKAVLPPSLSGVVGKLKNDYSYKNYNLAATFFERITQSGEIYHSGILNQLNQKEDDKLYFSNWSLKGLRAGADQKGNNLINFQNFNFGAKVPVVVSTIGKGDGGEVVNYENIGITISRFNLPVNTPTLIGSLATQKSDEFIFLILTVRPVS